MKDESGQKSEDRQRSTGYREIVHDSCGIGAVVNIKGAKSHDTVEKAITIVEHLDHRAGKDAEEKTGDGVGILLQISHLFFSKKMQKLGIDLGDEGNYGIGMFFFPQAAEARERAKKLFEIIAEKEGLKFMGWRVVETEPSVLGRRALEKMPYIMQAFVKRPHECEKGIGFDRKLYIVRRVFEHSNEDTYIVSLSSRTIVYKGMFLVDQLGKFFSDLRDPNYKSALAIVHSRFSTNTNPSWERAHPYRYLVHNGEINTIHGNVDKMQAREETMESGMLSGQLQKILPAIEESGSDSAMLDNALEFLMMSGMELPLAVMVTVPEPWMNNRSMDRKIRDFYQYYATMMEPWDGPASIVFSDGDIVGASLDRNGLRPSRYYIMDDDTLILASEVGALDVDQSKVVKKGRVMPGKMLLVDTKAGSFVDDHELKMRYASENPYGEWLDSRLITLGDLRIPNERIPRYEGDELRRVQEAFGYNDCKMSILNMAREGAESIGAMGTDTPLAVLSENHQPLFNYFKQRFAQVTNPPIDAIREKVVTATMTYMGRDGNLLEASEENCSVLRLDNPILTNTDLLKIKSMKDDGFKVSVQPITYYKNTGLRKAIEQLCINVDRLYREGYNVIILSDRGVDEYHMAIPSLLAVSALQRYLVKTKRRTLISLVLETGEPREIHHFAALLGFGASAVNPYLAYDTIGSFVKSGELEKDYYAAIEDYIRASLKGIMEIASKMGISTMQSYQGSKVFEAIGLSRDFIDEYFPGIESHIGGIGLDAIEKDYNDIHSRAYDLLAPPAKEKKEDDLECSKCGDKNCRLCEKHLYNPSTISLLQKSTRKGDYSIFKQYTEKVDREAAEINLRGLLDFRFPKQGVKLSEVESVDSLVTRFKTGAMSYGSISKEAHEALAVAMNSLHGKSNSGEGGEETERFTIGDDGLNKSSAIKQVASGRFGVTSRYLVNAEEIQIKMAQGAKPGEGGLLPGKKVYPWIAATRHSTPGVSLISPPPHHDIYSIEDLAQLIFDCKNANRKAHISVKLVSEAGVGTVAVGCAKAGAECILISGHDGGTGAAPRNSIKNAGLPWEMSLAETHRELISNGLRRRVKLEVDGKLMSGRDVAIAALMGAEEFGFATAPLVTLGCVMMRVCNLDTCPVGVATQDPELRKKFHGRPEYVENFMRFIAQELREYMAKLGIKKLDDMVGRTDLLTVKKDAPARNAQTIDFSEILTNPYLKSKRKCIYQPGFAYDFKLEKSADRKQLMDNFLDALEAGKGDPAAVEHRSISIDINNRNRTLGTMFGSEITERYPDGLAEDTFTVSCRGYGGQSFGAFIPAGLTLSVEGDSNDYFGKGLSGGKLIIYPPKEAVFRAAENVIIGNVALYGATSGQAYINGAAGERFCVRNSGACAVAEGIGEHGCEYMTGGCVAVIGPVGKNFAAGMSGGVAYVLDPDNELYRVVNRDSVAMEKIESKDDVFRLKKMLQKHVEYTGSERAQEILGNLMEYIGKFKKIIPFDYERIINRITEFEGLGMSTEEARMQAFLEVRNEIEQ